MNVDEKEEFSREDYDLANIEIQKEVEKAQINLNVTDISLDNMSINEDPSLNNSTTSHDSHSVAKRNLEYAHSENQRLEYENMQVRADFDELHTKYADLQAQVQLLMGERGKQNKVRFQSSISNEVMPTTSSFVSSNSASTSYAINSPRSRADELRELIKATQNEMKNESSSNPGILTFMDILQHRTVIAKFKTYPNHSFDDDSVYEELTKLIDRLISHLSSKYPAESSNEIVKNIKHYGTYLIVCPHEDMMNDLIEIGSLGLTIFGKNVDIVKYSSEFFENLIMVSSTDIKHDTTTMKTALENIFSFDTVSWQTVCAHRGKIVTTSDFNGVIMEYHIPTESVKYLRDQSDGVYVHFNVNNSPATIKFAVDRFFSYRNFNPSHKLVIEFSNQLGLVYDPWKGVASEDDSKTINQRRNRVISRVEPYRRADNNRNRSRSRPRRF